MSTYTNPVSTPTGPHIESEDSAAKRRRINFACNYCRSRKTRCDEQKPSCRACIAAGIECVTTDRRRPGVEVQRRETKRRMSRASTSSLTHSLTTNTSPRSPHDVKTVEPAETPAKILPPGDFHRNDGRGPAARAAALTRETIAVIDEDEENSTNQPPAKYQGKLPVVRPSRGRNSVEILGDWLDLAARRLGIQQKRGLPPGPEKPSSHRIRALLSSEPLPLPPKDTAQKLASRFLDGVNLVYPLVNRDRFQQDLDVASEHGPVRFAEDRGIAALSTVYLVLSIGFASESLSELPSDARDYMSYCKTLLGHLVTNNNADTVRAIVLLALCLHCYDNCAGAWNTLGVGVSMAVSLGLHKPRTCQGCRRDRPNKRADFVDKEERRKFWLGIYAFEKLLAFEMGRLSSIDDEDCYPPCVDMPIGNGTSSEEKAFPVTVDLARILSDIGRKAVIVSRKEDGLRDSALQAIIAEKVQTTGEAQLLLTRWGESVPDELRLVILSRNSLLVSEEAITTGANIIAKGKPWDYMMRNGQSLAANSARKVLRIVVEAVDSKSNAILPNLLAPLHALSTLAVHVITHPDSRISTMDLHKLDALLQKGLPPPGGPEYQRLDAITTNTPRSEANPWDNAEEASSHRTPEVAWAGSGDNQPRETDCHIPNPTIPFYSQGHAVTGANHFGFDTFGTMPMAGDEWSPSLSDGIGWDWACFSQLLSEQYQPR
ncbi:fungal specific transcription factor domain-containing protein [Colletotrichum incanum]|uniref:Fungal specific transcription factor domain-containing protein n=1 Tax=Colletotrichum incanum TaxID=1573173 RepID=A0A166WGZ4_COLIC|nr:fungal specific transcription factor domain-containing protein [Colletotrichum incanum]